MTRKLTYTFSRPQQSQLEKLAAWYKELRRGTDMPIVPDYFQSLPETTFTGTWKQVFNEPLKYSAKILIVGEEKAGFIKVGASYWSEKLPEEFSKAMDGAELPSGTGELHQIYVVPEFREQGLGYILYEQACRELCGLGYKNLIVGTYKANERAVQFYQRMGGEIISDKIWKVLSGDGAFYLPSIFLLHRNIGTARTQSLG